MHTHSLYLGGMTVALYTLLRNYHLADVTINYIIKHSNPVDLGGDNAAQLAVFGVIWIAVPVF